jgi:hypothetical protein
MTDFPAPSADDTPIDAESLFLMLRRKQGNWVEWGQACQHLQKAGYTPQAIFEETGFEPIQQNQIMVAAQVYGGLVQANAAPDVLEHFQQRGSDILYEFRVLTQPERVAAAGFALVHQFDGPEAHDLTKALKDFSRLSKAPDAFTNHPGDAVAHQCWAHARQQSDLQARSRLIAKGLKFAHSDTARKALEKLLTDFTIVKGQSAPRLPLYRLESEEDLSRILPLVGKLPLPIEALTAIPLVEAEGAFGIVKFAGEGAWISLPGWRVLLRAEDPVALLCSSDRLPISLDQSADQTTEEVMIVVDRAQCTWDNQSYFITDTQGQLDIQWFAEQPRESLLGQILIVVRPRRILDETINKELWLTDE